MDLQLRGRWAVVTGGNAGIGAATVEAFAREGCHVAFCGRNAGRNAAVAERVRALGMRVLATTLDVTDLDALRGWLRGLPAIDCFVPNVSALSGDWEAAIATDLRASVVATEEAIDRMRVAGRGGAVTAIGSKAATYGLPDAMAYGATKAALVHVMKSLSLKHAAQGIRVNVVSPGDTLVEGGFWDRIRRERPAVYERTRAANPMGRLAHPDEIARAVVFLSAPVASHVNGAHLLVDGGATPHVHG